MIQGWVSSRNIAAPVGRVKFPSVASTGVFTGANGAFGSPVRGYLAPNTGAFTGSIADLVSRDVFRVPKPVSGFYPK